MPRREFYTQAPPARFGIGAILAILAALSSFILTAYGYPLTGLLLALLSIPLGLVGFLRAISPGLRGGLVPILAVTLSALALLLALLAAFLGPL